MLPLAGCLIYQLTLAPVSKYNTERIQMVNVWKQSKVKLHTARQELNTTENLVEVNVATIDSRFVHTIVRPIPWQLASFQFREIPITMDKPGHHQTQCTKTQKWCFAIKAC